MVIIIVLAILAVIGSVFMGRLPTISRWHPLAPRNDFSMVLRGKNLTVAPGKTINGGILVIGADARIHGDVQGSVIVRNGNLTVYSGGKVQGDAVAVGGRLHIADNAVVLGKRILAEQSIFGPPGHEFGPVPKHRFGLQGLKFGMRVYRFGPGRGFGPNFLIGSGIRLFIMLFTLGVFVGFSILFAKVRPELLKRAGNTIVDRTLATVLIGSAALAILFLATNVVRIFIGFPVIALLGLALSILILVPAIIPAHVIGVAIGRQLSEKYGFIKQTALGALLVGLSIFLPFLGGFILIAFSAVGIGSLLVQHHR